MLCCLLFLSYLLLMELSKLCMIIIQLLTLLWRHGFTAPLQLSKLCVIKFGEVHLFRDGQRVTDPSFVQEAGGFTFFGAGALSGAYRCPYTVKVCFRGTASSWHVGWGGKHFFSCSMH